MPGFDALGRLALGQLPQAIGNGQGTITGAAGIGIAGSIVASVLPGISPASGIGVAGSIAVNPAVLIIGVAGIGVAGSITLRYVNFFGVAGVGVAGALVPNPQKTYPQAAGTGVAGILSNSEQAFLLGVSGGGVVGTIVGQSTAPVLVQASGIGVAGQITPNPGSSLAVACTGRAGIITVDISGGGGSAGATGDGERPPSRKRQRTGLEPIARRPDPPAPVPKPIELPPEWLKPRRKSPPLVPVQSAERTEPQFDHEMHRISMQIADAQDISDVLQLLEQLD